MPAFTISRELGLPLLVYAGVSYALVSFKPAALFDPKTGAPRAFGANPATGEVLCPWWLVAFLAAYAAAHLTIPHSPLRTFDL